MSTTRFLLLDSCVVIDYLKTDRELFKLISEYIGDVYIADEMIPEIKEVYGDGVLVELGLKFSEVDQEDLGMAAILAEKGALSDNDHICLLTAKRNGFVCVTNDSKLHRECELKNVTTMWGLQLLLRLYEVGGIDQERTRKIGTRICENPWISKEVCQRFLQRLEVISVEKERHV